MPGCSDLHNGISICHPRKSVCVKGRGTLGFRRFHMATFRAFWLLALAGLALFGPQSRAVSTNLVFDATTKEFVAKPGERTAEFDFAVTNTGPVQVTINSVRASCGCTTPKLPSLPWKLEPGASGSFHVTTDLAGKFGTFQKSVFMDTTEGAKLVYVKITVPTGTNASAMMAGVDARTRNMQIAHADPQAIFRGECANCHSKPTLGKKGEELFTAACAICHESNERAVLVPDLHALKQAPTEAYWDAWIRNGKVGTMMPAFALEKQGPLSNEQIESLVEYLQKDFPARKAHGSGIRTASAVKRSAAPQIELPGSAPLLPPVAPTVPPPAPSPVAPTPNK
jgi:mono/diheme cytochrome c family protein